MINEMKYVPILRWKQAERLALRALNEEDRTRVTPLIELIPTIFKPRKQPGIPYTPDPTRRQGDSLFLKVDVDGETVRVFGRPEELAERLEASGYDIPASEIEAGMELHLPCLVKVGQGNNGYKNIEEFLSEAAE